MNSNSKVLCNCVYVKTILMCVVIIGHACAFWSGNWFIVAEPNIQSVGIKVFYSWVGAFHVYTFALVSGYLFELKVLGGGYKKYGLFIKNKAKRLLIPYLFSMIIWVAPVSEYFFKWDTLYLVKKYILCIQPSQLWFLWMLFGAFAIVWPLRDVMIQKPIMGYVISLLCYVVGFIGSKIGPNIFCIWTAFQFIPFFFIGMRIRSKEESGEKLITETIPFYIWIALDLIVFFITEFAYGRDGIIWKSVTVLNFLLHIIGAIMAWTTLQFIANHMHWQENNIFMKLAANSMPMYLFHQQIIYFTIVWLNGKVNPWIHAGINFIVALAGSFLISSVLMKWKVTRFLIGE